MVADGTQWYQMVLNDTKWYLIVQNGTQWSPMVTNGNQWYQIVPNGTKLYLMLPKGTLHLMFLFSLTWQLLGKTKQTQSRKTFPPQLTNNLTKVINIRNTLSGCKV